MPSLLPHDLCHGAEFLTLAPDSDRIPVELFQILKDDVVESAALNMQYAICTQYAICRLPAILSILVDSELSCKIFLYHIVNYFQSLKLDKMYLVTKLLDES